MKCNNVSFHYRGSCVSQGKMLAELLSDITVSYKHGEGLDQVQSCFDLGAMLRLLDVAYHESVAQRDEAQKKKTVPDPAGFVVQIPVPLIIVRDLKTQMWLQGLNVEFDKPVTLQFVRGYENPASCGCPYDVSDPVRRINHHLNCPERGPGWC